MNAHFYYYSGKTSLLFQYAVNSAAAEKNGEVVFICNRRRLESKPPFLSQGVDSTNSILNGYVEDEERIEKYFAAFHFHDTSFPTAVIIDDFGDFFDDRCGSGSFLLQNIIRSGSGRSERKQTARYSFALQYLLLEGITEDVNSDV